MAATTRAKDVISRRYVQLKLNRDRRRILHVAVREYIDALKAWLKGSPKRTKRKSGLGR